MDYFSRQVSRHWYQLYYTVALMISLTMLAACGLARFVPRLHIHASFGLSLTVALLAGLHAFCSLVSLSFVRRAGWPLVVFMSSFLLTLALLAAIVRTDLSIYSLPYMAAWVVSAVFSGMFGLPILLGSVFMTMLCMLLITKFQVAWVSSWGWLWLGAEVV